MKKFFMLLLSHLLFAAIGFAGGIYYLPILLQPEAPSRSEIVGMADTATYRGTFLPDLKGSDWLHNGHGKVYIAGGKVGFLGELTPGPDYKLYLTPEFVEDEDSFLAIKGQSAYIGDVETFNNFALPLPPGVDPAGYKAMVVWCEAFEEFITAARYQASSG